MEPNRIGDQWLYTGDVLEILKLLPQASVDIVVTSPPYNLGKDYGGITSDRLKHSHYCWWMREVFEQIARLLRQDGSFFLNMGFSNQNPWVAMDVAQQARLYFELQNQFCWVKSISVGETTFGHFQPITSRRYVNPCWEHVFHFTKTGAVPIDRLALGVPYVDKGNLKRGNRGKNGDRRCRGNAWFVPYTTVQKRGEKGDHPAIYPEQLVECCLRLHGLRPGLVVLDPFVGTGTTLKVCQDLGVTGIGIDVNPSYIAWAADRLQHAKE